MAIASFFEIITTISLFWNTVIFISLAWLLVVVVIVIIFILTSRKKKGIDVSALAALASSEPMSEDTAPNADPKEVMAILQIERVAASTALSAVKDARKSKRISSSVRDSLANRYKARIAKIDADLKRRSGAQEYKSLADSLEQSRDRVRGEIAPSVSQSSIPPPPSSTPGIPSIAPPVPGIPSAPPTTGPPRAPSLGTPPSKPSSPIPTPPRISPVSPSARPTTVVPPSVAPPTVSTPPLPPKLPSSSPIAPPTTSNMAPPPVPTSTSSVPTTAPVAPTGDGQSISGLRMEMLRELARLKKFMSEEARD